MADQIAPVRIRLDDETTRHHLDVAQATELDRWGDGTWGEVLAQHVVAGDEIYTDVQPRTAGGRRALTAAVDRSSRHSIVAVDWGP